MIFRKAMVCFGIEYPEYKQCDTFDGTSVGSLPNSSQRHHWGCLAHYNGYPTAVGGFIPKSGIAQAYPPSSSVESFIAHLDSWDSLTDHPKFNPISYKSYTF